MFTLTLIVVILLWALLKVLRANFKTFADRGVKFEEPVLIFGNVLRGAMGKESILDTIQNLYDKYHNERVFGFFNFNRPNFIINDAEVIKQITIKDFDSFVNHDKLFDESVDKLFGKSLFQMFDEKWRTMRNSLSPIFTSAKMKMMFGILTECAQDFIEHFEDKIDKNGKIIVDVRDKFSRYTVNGISTAALGFQGDCIKNEDSYIFKTAMDMANPPFSANLKILLATLCKPLYVALGLQFTPQKTLDFFEKSVVDVMDDRDSKGAFRPDVIQLLLQIKKGKLDKNEKNDEKDLANFSANIEYDVGGGQMQKWEKEDFMAQGFIFFAAGFDTTQRLLQLAAYELALNRDVQDELLMEVDDVLSTLDGKPVTYEALHKMKFLDQFISEVLRLHPPVPFTNRECNKDYVMNLGNGQKVPVKKGENILIPVQSIHRNEKYFKNAGKFDPHRFDDDKKDEIVPGSYIPFGYGPRVCIGSRFALMEAKLLIFYILSKFTIEKCDKTPRKLEFKPSLFAFDFKDRIFVEFKPRT